jgi:hypothetical protein
VSALTVLVHSERLTGAAGRSLVAERDSAGDVARVVPAGMRREASRKPDRTGNGELVAAAARLMA